MTSDLEIEELRMDEEEGNPERRWSRLTHAGHSLVHMACLRYPRTMARLLGELPLKSLRSIYSVASAGLEQNIPNNVYQTWEVDRVGRTHRSELARFRAQNSEYSFHFYDREQRDEYMETYFGQEKILDVYRRARYGPLRADIWRYCILWERGGVYFDINKMPGVPLGQLIGKADLGIVSFERNSSPKRCPPSVAPHLLFPKNNVLNWGLMFTKNHRFLRLVIDRIVEKAPSVVGREVPSVKNSILDFSGPHHLTECLYQYIEENGSDHLTQAGIDFFAKGSVEMRRSFVRYVSARSYSLSTRGIILE